MRIAVCDDLPEQIKKIEHAVEKFLDHRTDVFFEIESFDKAFDFLDAQDKSNYQIALLDICMPGLLGTDIAREIRKKRYNTEIIFLTTSDEFALDAFGVNAAHYLLKPFLQTEFNEAMCRALQNIDNKALKTVYFKGPKGTIQAVDKNAICFIEGASHRQNIFLSDGKTVQSVQTLCEIKEMLESLSKGQFIMPYKGYIVNQQTISRIENNKIVLRSGECIPLSRHTFNTVKQAYFNYMFTGKK